MALFNDWWNKGTKLELKIQDSAISKTNELDNLPITDPYEIISQEYLRNFDSGLFSLPPDAQGEDYEEEQFAKQMKKRKKNLE